ncbi:MAG: hypothetical protein JWP08_483 [Bryobacterales bacterium]|nr:hypothetical protein [Bryobacterales bacterium]
MKSGQIHTGHVVLSQSSINRALRAAIIALTASFLLGSQVAQSQQSNSSMNMLGYKDPGTSTLIGVLVTGGGQFYSGETTKGATLLGIGLGSLVLGAAASGTSCGTYASYSSCSTNTTPLLIGTLAYIGTWVYGIMDAGNAARRHNTSLGMKTIGATPMVRVLADGRKGMGISVALP